MFTDNFPSGKWPGDPPGGHFGGTHYQEYDGKSGATIDDHDTINNPSICPRCEITIYPGYSHSNLAECFVSLKAFVKLCQDEIEEQRMKDMQHPTREELIRDLKDIQEQFRKLGVFADRAAGLIQNSLRATL
jgi:uncharacterized protein YllA (UPF0747 family)